MNFFMLLNYICTLTASPWTTSAAARAVIHGGYCLTSSNNPVDTLDTVCGEGEREREGERQPNKIRR